MITAWVLYFNGNQFKFEELTGTDYASSNPADWGLPADDDHMINLVLQNGSFIAAWLDGIRKP